MKKTLYILCGILFAMLAATTFASCGGDEPSSDHQTDPDTDGGEVVENANLVGVWDQADFRDGDQYYDVRYTFEANGRGSCWQGTNGYNITAPISWSYDGKKGMLTVVFFPDQDLRYRTLNRITFHGDDCFRINKFVYDIWDFETEEWERPTDWGDAPAEYVYYRVK